MPVTVVADAGIKEAVVGPIGKYEPVVVVGRTRPPLVAGVEPSDWQVQMKLELEMFEILPVTVTDLLFVWRSPLWNPRIVLIVTSFVRETLLKLFMVRLATEDGRPVPVV